MPDLNIDSSWKNKEHIWNFTSEVGRPQRKLTLDGRYDSDPFPELLYSNGMGYSNLLHWNEYQAIVI